MVKRTLRAIAATGIALGASIGMAGAANAAGTADEVLNGGDHSINIGNNACVLPWYWQGPFNVGTIGESGVYAACNDGEMTEAEGINILNDACIAPWFWQGPVNFLTAGQEGTYAACND